MTPHSPTIAPVLDTSLRPDGGSRVTLYLYWTLSPLASAQLLDPMDIKHGTVSTWFFPNRSHCIIDIFIYNLQNQRTSINTNDKKSLNNSRLDFFMTPWPREISLTPYRGPTAGIAPSVSLAQLLQPVVGGQRCRFAGSHLGYPCPSSRTGNCRGSLAHGRALVPLLPGSRSSAGPEDIRIAARAL